MIKKSLAEQIGGKCKHFTGIQNATCKRGVNYEELVGGGRTGIGCRIPCTGDNGCAHAPNIKVVPCALREFPTPEEVQAEEEMIQVEIEKQLTNLATDICPDCERPIEEYRQVGRSVYASPCGHRLYQGKVPSDKPHLIVSEYPDWMDV
jgi:hypothetical protein